MANSDLDFDAELKGEFYWELYLDIDNSTNSGKIVREAEVETVVSISYNSMIKSVKSSTIGTSLGLDVGGLFDVISVGVKGSLTTEVKSEYENIANSKKESVTTTKKKDTIEVGAHSSLKLYRLAFKGPGVSYTTDTLSTSTDTRPEVPIEIKGRLIPVLKGIEVVYTSDSVSRPDDLLQEARGYDPDINKEWNEKIKYFKKIAVPNPLFPMEIPGFNTSTESYSYAWLRPIWTKKVSEGVTGIQVVIQSERNDSYQDMSKGSGGDNRYLKMLKDPHSKHRITGIALWRRLHNPGGEVEAEYSTKDGPFKFATTDINKGRGGDDLWVVWNAMDLK